MPEILKEQVVEILSGMMDIKAVSDIKIKEGKVVISVTIPKEKLQEMEVIQKKAKAAIEALEGVTYAIITIVTERPKEIKCSDNIKYIIAIASGKGGVGKSTVAANLAMSFALEGKRTGLMDADIYGPSQPRMMGVSGSPQIDSQNLIIPPVAHGVKVMSVGLFMQKEEPIIWRGPKLHSMINQMLNGTNWGELDVLVIDMPPGTGDIQLSVPQCVDLAGVVVVSTPQEVALTEARKGLIMFDKVQVPLLGIIENMSYFVCPHCGEREDIFDSGKTKATADKMVVEFLGEIPINSKIRSCSDNGTPFVLDNKKDEISLIYRDIAKKIFTKLEILESRTPEDVF